jgi:alkylation response protein AidB-like acyl-CoA dehydrogenase
MVVKDVFVPSEFAIAWDRTKPLHPGPLYGFSIMGLFAPCVAAVALGIARGAMDEVLQTALTKIPVGRRKPLADWGVAQVEIAQAEAALRSGRAFLFEAVDEVWQTLVRGDEPSARQRALVRLAATMAAAGAVRVVDCAYNLGGGSSIYESSLQQRRFRDIHTLTQHNLVAPSSLEAAGRVLLGQELPPGFL